jgi:hypothetical protein
MLQLPRRPPRATFPELATEGALYRRSPPVASLILTTTTTKGSALLCQPPPLPEASWKEKTASAHM